MSALTPGRGCRRGHGIASSSAHIGRRLAALILTTIAGASAAAGQGRLVLPPPAIPVFLDASLAAPDISLVWRNRPQIRIGDNVRIDLKARVQTDWRSFAPDIGEDTFALQAARFGVAGEIRNDVEFQVEYDTRNDRPWRDVYGEWKTFRQFTVRGGRFKMPFGLEQNTPYFDLDFAYRTLGSSVITPNRDLGVMASGRFHRRAVTYDLGVFRGDGDNGEIDPPPDVPPGTQRQGPSVAGRLTALPLRWSGATLLETLRVGVAATASNLPEGLNSLHSDGRLGGESFFKPVYVKGYRRRVGTELHWAPGPFGVSSEWMRAWDSRDGQGFADVDLPDVWSTAWYLSGTWVLTGERKEGGAIHPAHPLLQGGWGAVEVGARYERIRFESAAREGVFERNPRGTRLSPNQDRVWTLGANWFLNRWVRVVGNAVHEHFDDPLRTAAPPTQDFWGGVFRIQVVM